MKIFVWGTGIKFGFLRDRVIHLDEIEGFIDNKLKGEYLGKKVYAPSELPGMEYDAIIVANNSSLEIYQQCLELGIDISKVIFVYKNCRMEYLNDNWELTEKVLGKAYTDFLKNKYHIVNSPSIDEERGGDERASEADTIYQEDYVRAKTFLAVADLINSQHIEGEVAEFGVFRGDFARIINKAFPDRRLYLFDSFQGFVPEEEKKERNRGTSNESFSDAFVDTAVERVMEKMSYPQNVIVKKGYFPESLGGLEERFAFLSLDVDFEESTFKGLEYFYPRMNEGGYIFIHDYNWGFSDSVKQAVRRYEEEYKVVLKKVPLCDYNGTLVIVK